MVARYALHIDTAPGPVSPTLAFVSRSEEFATADGEEGDLAGNDWRLEIPAGKIRLEHQAARRYRIG